MKDVCLITGLSVDLSKVVRRELGKQLLNNNYGRFASNTDRIFISEPLNYGTNKRDFVYADTDRAYKGGI